MAHKEEIKASSDNNLDISQIMKIVKNDDELAKYLT
jgi:hypothetical protein